MRRLLAAATMGVGIATLMGVGVFAGAYAQGYPPQMTPNGQMIPGFAGHQPTLPNQQAMDEIVSGYHTYRDPRTGYGYTGNNNMNQWMGPGNHRAQTWYGPPAGPGWYQLNR